MIMNNNCINNNNYDLDNNNEYNNKLYNLVFNNKYIKSIILNHLNKFNILYNNIEFKSIEELNQFKYKEYLNKVKIIYDNNLNQLPNNIRHITIKLSSYNYLNDVVSIPDHIESIELQHFKSLDSAFMKSLNSTSKLTTLNLEEYRYINSTSIPHSVTNLKIYSYGMNTNEGLAKNILSNNIKTLSFVNMPSYQDGCLPESITCASLISSPVSIINQFSSNGLLKLYVGKIDTTFDNTIRFPNTLQELHIRCKTFYSTLPCNLKSIIIDIELYQRIKFPASLEHLAIRIGAMIYDNIFDNKIDVPHKLKTLEFPCSSIIDRNGQSILPNTLERLFITHIESPLEIIEFNQVLQVNQLPSSLTILDLGPSFNQAIDIGVLPSTLKQLILGYSYTQVINPLAIPQQLKLLEINNSKYPHPIKLLPSSHPYTTISCSNINLYYDPSNTDIRVLRLPIKFYSQLSTLQLQDKSKLEYLHLGFIFNHSIQLSDLPINNQIKTLELSNHFKGTINLQYFQNLETIIIGIFPVIITTTKDEYGCYNNFKLKNIIVDTNNTRFIKLLDINFYQFIKKKINK